MPYTAQPHSAIRLEDRRFLTGTGSYCADMSRDGQLHAVVLRSEHSHARILSLDTRHARALPGVVAVHDAGDLAADGLGPLPCVSQLAGNAPLIVPPRHALAPERVRHVGDPIALILANTREAGLDALQCIELEMSALDPVVDARLALAEDAPQLWTQAPGNLAFDFRLGDHGATGDAMGNAAHVVELEVYNHRVSAQPLEPRAGLAEYDGHTGTFTLTATAQGLHAIRRQLAGSVFGLPEDRFRITAPDVGGGFGLKNFLYPEWVLLLWAARRHGRPVKWVAERGEELTAAAHARDVSATARLALDADGRFLALEADLVANMGAYLSGSGPNITTKALPTALSGIYEIPEVALRARGVFTNTAPVDAYRGAGKPEANFLLERLIDVAARRCGFDPVQLRLDNAMHTFPHRTALGMTIDGGRFAHNIRAAVSLADRDGFGARREASARRGALRGLGVGCFLETARGAPQEGAEIRFTSDGLVELRVGTESHGQGHETSYLQIASQRLGLPMASFRYVQADTARTRMGNGHGGARSMHMGGAALVKTLDRVIDRARSVAAQLLQAEEGALRFEHGHFTLAPDHERLSLLEVARASRELQADGHGTLDTFCSVEDAPFTFPNGCHVAEVEIDEATGAVSLVSYLCVDDYGALINPRLTEGQVHGGVAQGIGQALMEHVVYEGESGQLLSGSFMDYSLPAATCFPDFEVHLKGTPTDANPLGVKGSGQAGAIAAPQAVMNAIADALAPLGIDHLDMPATSERLWRLIRHARGAA